MTQPTQDLPLGVTIDAATPAWSRDLAETAPLLPLGFCEEAVRYATYDDLPDNLKVIYRKARRQWQHARRARRPSHHTER